MTINLDMWEPQRDRWGRPLIVPPGGGKPVGYTRATTVAKTLDDEGSLTAWAQRMTAAGLARRPDLLALVASNLDPNGDIPAERRNTVQALCDQAKEAAAASSAANLGTALHGLTEQYDLGNAPAFVPEQFKADIDAYRRAVEPFEVLAVEQFVVLDDYQIGGTLDRLWRLPDGRVVIADLKTGQNLDYSWRSISVQLAIYAAGTRYHDGLRSPLCVDSKVDTDLGIVIHLPVGQGRCDLYTVDLRAGWVALQHSVWAREWRKRKDIASPYVPVPASASPSVRDAAPAPQASTPEHGGEGAAPGRDTVVERIRRISAADGGRAWLKLHWPAGMPTLKQSLEHSVADLAVIARLCDDAERDLALPFTDADITRDPAPDTSTPAPVARPDWRRPADGRKLSKAATDSLRTSLQTLETPVRHLVSAWMRDAEANGRPVIVDKQHTERSQAVIACMVTCARWLDEQLDGDEDYLRLVVAAALDSDIAAFPATALGAAFASLSKPEAQALTGIVERAQQGEPVPVTFDDTGHARLRLDTAA